MNPVLSILLVAALMGMAEIRAAEENGKLVWSDEFDGAAIDRGKWNFDAGNGFVAGDTKQYIAGWGNNELEFYTDRPENAYLKDGALHICALKEAYEGFQFTSARLKTKGRFAKQYGRFEMRARLPLGKGIWPAIWMLPLEEAYGPWAASGEIDILEARGNEPSKVLGTIHFGSRWPANDHVGGEYVFPEGGAINEFHVYSLEWEPGEIRWAVDGKVYATQTKWWSSSKTDQGRGVKPENEADKNPFPAPFDKPFFLLINLAVGGNFLGDPDATTPFPAEMVIDYVRVYDRAGGAPQ